jgi:hypothetical protein
LKNETKRKKTIIGHETNETKQQNLRNETKRIEKKKKQETKRKNLRTETKRNEKKITFFKPWLCCIHFGTSLRHTATVTLVFFVENLPFFLQKS